MIILLWTIRQELVDLVKSACSKIWSNIDLLTFENEDDLMSRKDDLEPNIVLIDIVDLTTAIPTCGRVYWPFSESRLIAVVDEKPSAILTAAMIEAGCRRILFRPTENEMVQEFFEQLKRVS